MHMASATRRQLVMRRPSLEGIPPVVLPEGYVLRTYREGDEVQIARIFNNSFNPEWDSAKVMRDLVGLVEGLGPERVFIVAFRDLAIATASAWAKPDKWPDSGYLHMVAVDPPHRGKRLGRAVITRVLECFKKLGYRDVVLETDDFRLPAIKTYIGLGFQPIVFDAEHEERWKAVYRELKLDFGATAKGGDLMG